MIQESQKENILGTLGQDGESSFDQWGLRTQEK
jgi:hypothetical protein